MKFQIIIIIISLFAYSCTEKAEIKPEIEKKDTNSIIFNDSTMSQIDVQDVKMVADPDELVVVGEVSFDEDNIVRVFPIVSGSVEKISVSLGDYVTKGQHLATIMSTDINEYQVNFSIAKSNYNIAEKNLSRIKELYISKFASERELSEAQNEYNNAKSEFNGKRKLLELYGGKEGANDALYRVTAPNSGYIVERTVNEGTQIRTDNNSNLFIISDLKTVWVWANVYESDISKIKVGDQVSVSTIAYPDKEYKGVIKKIGSVLDAAARVVKVRIDLENPNELLKPEMFATVTIFSSAANEILGVPKNALIIENNRTFVVKQTAENTFSKVEVTQGKGGHNFIEIKGGINVGDKIVTDDALFVATSINNQ
ncbi:MAG TPA: efflux RND transporter periplasmic adaptor subunit [Saprospiraceae bacterium]|nr:efflux RND transporter periplasmic adaptor subunit [Saprospiraceae bacterium]